MNRVAAAETTSLRSHDHPANNGHEAAVFRDVGLEVDAVTRNEAADRALPARKYDLVISDIGRDSEDTKVGLRVPELVKSSGSPNTPCSSMSGVLKLV
jgi:CheY-like chemotaxis protein